MDLVDARPARPSYAERRDRLVELLRAMAATGLTGAHVMDLGDLDVPGLLSTVESDGDLPLRLRLAPWCMPGADAEELAELSRSRGGPDGHWRVGGVKFFMDGTVEGGTAWLEHADCHGQGTDAFWPDPAAYAAAVRPCTGRGRVPRPTPSATRPSGTSSTPSPSLGRAGGSASDRAHRAVPDDQLARFAELGVIASMQPPHTATPGPICPTSGHAAGGGTGGPRPGAAVTCGTRVSCVALGSDWPIAHHDARHVLATARDPQGAASRGPG